MIVYRKLKAYRKEATLIRKVIAAHEKDMEKRQRSWVKSYQNRTGAMQRGSCVP
ncbi:hypothetical protein SAMN04488524_3164 [Pedobacter africanus]|uniref:Uncharacterized protein n=1 Tax=Pedobacter africanus TaxID=151894 RepID=A0A1W2CS16_9SPHI|nr:hypothetical protein SAMN04488524_3164 [Pedobacter africanus]